MELIYAVLMAVGAFAIGSVTFAVIFRKLGYNARKRIAESEIGSAEEEAKRIREDGAKQAETMKKEALISAKEEILKQRNEAEKELKERRADISRTERRLVQKEENLDKKAETLESKNEVLDRKIKENDVLKEQINELRMKELDVLEKISGYSVQEAKDELVARVESEIKHELAQRLDALEAQFKEDADAKAKNIISLAIQRCAADHVAETTVSVVSIPSEDMKGRIIGREGRNIQMLEKLTGVELIIDDTPEAITLSGFDPVRREIARNTLEKLISDGRIHPSRIEEMVEKATREVEAGIKQAGERATFDVGIHGINTDLVKMLGRLRYRTSYGQNVLKHSIEVALISGMIADELGIDSTVAKRAGLLHDIGRRNGIMQARHALEGFNYLISIGFDTGARICMTHTFQYKDVDAIYDTWDCSADEKQFIKNYLDNIAYDDYDKLIQLCDALSLANGYCYAEKKMVNSVLKFGFKDTTANKWKAIFELKAYFDTMICGDVYSLFCELKQAK